MGWRHKRRRDEERARCQGRVNELLLRAAGGAPPLSRGNLSIGPSQIQEGSLVRSAKYLLTLTQLVYVVTSEGPAYRSGKAFLYHSADIGFDELTPGVIDLAGGIRSYRNSPSTTRSHGRVEVTLIDGDSFSLVFVPQGVYGDRLVEATDAAQSMFCRIAGASGAEDLGASRPDD
jgi:hypothetical protein